MNPEQILSQLKKAAGSLGPRQLASLGLALVGVVGVVLGSAYWINKPTFALLADDLDAESASAVVAKLKTQNVAYQLSDDGKSIRVPVEKVAELRLAVASEGLPSAGHIGFELFDKTSFGTTDRQEQTNYQRALQGELERTILAISEVSFARVHLTLPKDSLFADQAEPAKGSVMLRLKTNRPLTEARVRGIQRLVASAVTTLKPEAVSVLDAYGQPISRSPDDGSGLPAGLQLDRQQQIERDLGTRVVALLEPVVGPGRVRVNVAARLKADAEEETEERWDPTTVVRSRQTNTENDVRPGALANGGVAGAKGNVPEGAANTPAPVLTPNGSSRNSETTNYEVSKLTRHRLSPQGQLARLSVAVVVDDDRPEPAPGQPAPKGTPRTAEELQRLQKLVAAAVGFDAERGDQLTVENIAFDAAPDVLPLAPTGWPAWKDMLTNGVKDYGPGALRTMAVLALALTAFFGVLRPMGKRVLTLPRELPAPVMGERLRTVQEMEAAPSAPVIPPDAAHRLPSLSRQVARLANDEPEQLARIVRGWLAEEDR